MVALKAVVIALGVLILGTIGVIAVVLFNRGADVTAAGDPGAPFRVTFELGEGCLVAESRVAEGRLMIRTEGPGACPRIHLVDLATGEVAGTVELAPAP